MLTKVGGLRDGVRYVQWSGYSTAAVLAKTSVEVQKVVESIDRGQPVVLGLIQATNRSLKAQGRNHQVVCYGYRSDASGPLEFYICDPNEPPRASSNTPYEVILRCVADAEDSEFPYQVNRPHRADRWRGFFVVRYRPRQPNLDVINVCSTDGL
ncbi:C39 family peptidase [Yaniella flava]|uniref:C39 family peptidase n=1 Tax=Yaniella flava TaxID=287930 RepID=UPI003CD069E3